MDKHYYNRGTLLNAYVSNEAIDFLVEMREKTNISVSKLANDIIIDFRNRHNNDEIMEEIKKILQPDRTHHRYRKDKNDSTGENDKKDGGLEHSNKKPPQHIMINEKEGELND
jgi:hypothetical protein